MKTDAFRRILLALPALAACTPALAADGTPAQLGTLFALGWLAGIGCVLQRLLRRRLAVEDRVARLEAELCVERKARAGAELALADSHAVLRKVVRKQAGVRDAERARIARDVHDDLGQNLLALRIEMSLVQVQTCGMHPALHGKMGAMLGTLDHAIRSLRGVINALRPLGLDEGLRCAMQRQLAEFSRISGVRHEFTATVRAFDEAERAGGVDALLYRVLQEALSNVARHAQASLVRVTFGRVGECLVLRVEDDGVGMEGEPQRRGCGLAGMRERAHAERADLTIDSRPGAGTALSLSVPLAPQPVAG